MCLCARMFAYCHLSLGFVPFIQFFHDVGTQWSYPSLPFLLHWFSVFLSPLPNSYLKAEGQASSHLEPLGSGDTEISQKEKRKDGLEREKKNPVGFMLCTYASSHFIMKWSPGWTQMLQLVKSWFMSWWLQAKPASDNFLASHGSAHEKVAPASF